MAAYLIGDLQVTDSTAYATYREQVPAVVAAFGGRYLVRGGATRVLEGTVEPHLTAVLEFESMAQLQAFYDSPAYAPLKALRLRSTITQLVAVEGI